VKEEEETNMEKILLVVAMLVSLVNADAKCGLNRDCVTLRECPLIMQQLRLAQSARSESSFAAMNKILEAIKTTMCDEEVKTVCCPLYLGTFKLQSGSMCPVYALNATTVRLMEFPLLGELDVLDTYFWQVEDCLPITEFELKEETFNFNYNPEKSHLDVTLPPSVTVNTVRCMAAWNVEEYLGYAHLQLPIRELDDNTIEGEEED